MPSNHPPESAQDQSEPGRAVTTDQLLPSVEPPNARFIMQLFIVPAVIVLCVVLVWMLFGWLASHGEADARSIVTALRSSSHARWQAANELAHMLQMEKRYPKLKENRQLAGELAQLLSEYLEAGNADENSITMQSFLCRTLGEFRVDEGLAVLMKVAREDPQRDVRRAAINALAVLGNTLLEMEPRPAFDSDKLTRILIQLAADQDELIRSETAYAMGVTIQGLASSQGGETQVHGSTGAHGSMGVETVDPLVQQLEILVESFHVDTRYNAALALSRVGNTHAVETIAEMLDVEALAVSMAGEKDPRQQAFKRNLMLRNAIEAAAKLGQMNPGHDLSVLQNALRSFLNDGPAVVNPAPVPSVLYDQAEQALLAFQS
jgi:HEAT repeat protein